MKHRTRIAGLLPVLLALGCTTAGLPGSTDGGGVDLVAPAPDLAVLSCDQIAQQVQQWLDQHSSCRGDGDCMRLAGPCGLPSQCGVAAGPSSDGPFLSSLFEVWKARCPALCVPCPAPIAIAACLGGACAFRPPGQVGDPCGSGGDCTSGFCANEGGSKLFLGGYCTSICDAAGPCPDGMSDCVAGGDGKRYCLKRCDPQKPVDQCRTAAGYSCCGVGATGWCAPRLSPVCAPGG